MYFKCDIISVGEFMAKELKLLISPHDNLSTKNYMDVYLSDEIDSAFEAIEKQEGRDVPENFHCYLSSHEQVGNCYGVLTKTPYGDNLKYIKAKHLGEIPKLLETDGSNYNKSVGAFLKNLPPEAYIVLYWY